MSARMVLLGPPGAGKGTQAARIAERLGIPAISTGDIFRANVAGATELGTQAKAYMDKGEYVPDSITNAMVADRIAQNDCVAGFLLDGYPRTTAQVGELDSMLEASGLALDVVVEITADAEAVIARLLKRAGEQGRADDTEPVIRHRLEIYAESTAPLAGIYAERGLLVQVDGMGEIDVVTGRILEALAARGITAEEKHQGQIFAAERARGILTALHDGLAASGIHLHHHIAIHRQHYDGDSYRVETSHGDFHAPQLVIARGGAHQPPPRAAKPAVLCRLAAVFDQHEHHDLYAAGDP